MQVIPENDDGVPDATALEQQARKLRKAPLLLGSFSAGSNVTGIAPDLRALCKALHKHGGVAAFDYASAAACGRVQVRLPWLALVQHTSRICLLLQPCSVNVRQWPHAPQRALIMVTAHVETRVTLVLLICDGHGMRASSPKARVLCQTSKLRLVIHAFIILVTIVCM